MLSLKSFSLLVVAAVAMNGAVAIEQGYGGGVTLPSSTTATPADESPVQSTDLTATAANAYTGSSSVAGSSAIDEGSDASTPGKTGTTLSTTGSDVGGSSAIDQGSNSVPETASGSGAVGLGSASTSASASAPCDSSFSLANGSETGSDVAGSSALTSASGSEPVDIRPP
uniref:RxLR effector protein n=1 Tax=Phytophthora ramorum TaxID=164328 RepID=H3H6X2_PHYRM